MANGLYCRFDDDDNMKCTHILTIIIIEMDNLNTHSLIYWLKDNWENWLNLRHTLDTVYLTCSLEVQYLQICLHNDHIIRQYNDIRNKTQLSQDVCETGTQPWINKTTMGKIDTSDAMMIIRWVIKISPQSTKLPLLILLKWGAEYHSTPLHFVFSREGRGRCGWCVKTDTRSRLLAKKLWYNLLRCRATEKYTYENIFARCQQSVVYLAR